MTDLSLDPLFPFVIQELTREIESPVRTPGFQFLFFTKGVVYLKHRKGLILYRDRGAFIVPPSLGPRLRFPQGLSGYLIVLGSHMLEELETRVWDRGLFSFPKREISFRPLLPDQMTRLIQALEGLETEWKQKRRGYRDIIYLKLTEVMIHLARADNGSPLTTGDNSAIKPDISFAAGKIDEILDYLKIHCTEELSLAGMADHFGFSTAYFSRFFKQKSGTALFHHINKLRIQKACILLKKTDKSVLEIAFAVGYNNISFFNRFFKKIMNLSPLEYRKKQRQ